jgi:hypothetical protein
VSADIDAMIAALPCAPVGASNWATMCGPIWRAIVSRAPDAEHEATWIAQLVERAGGTTEAHAGEIEMTRLKSKRRGTTKPAPAANDAPEVTPAEVEAMIEALPSEMPTDAEPWAALMRPIYMAIAPLDPTCDERLAKRLKLKTGDPLDQHRKGIRAARKNLEADRAFGASTIRGELVAATMGYRDAETLELVSTFLVTPIRRLVGEERQNDVIETTLENPSRHHRTTATLPVRALRNRRALIDWLAGHGNTCQWTGTDDNTQALAKLINEADVPIARMTSVIGWHDGAAGPQFVAPETVIAPNGGDLMLVEPHPELASQLAYPMVDAVDVAALARQVFPLLAAINEPDVITPIVAWHGAAVVKVPLAVRLDHFPILGVFGTQGSGKTSTVRSVRRLVGYRDSAQPFSVEAPSAFVHLRLFSATTSVPIFIDEYRATELNQSNVTRLHHLLRQVYGGEVAQRGRPDLTVASYCLRAPVTLGGESEPDDAALRERLVVVRPSKLTTSEPARQRAFTALAQLPLERLAAPLVRFAMTWDVDAALAIARRRLDPEVAGALAEVDDARAVIAANVGALAPRRLDNLLALLVGAQLLEDFAASCGATLSLDVAAMAASTIDAATTGEDARDAFDAFLVECSTLAHEGALVEGVHYAHVDGALCVHVPSSYEVYLRRRMQTGRRDATNGLKALQRVAREKAARGDYVLDASYRTQLGSGANDARVRTARIDASRMPDDVGAFVRAAKARAVGVEW